MGKKKKKPEKAEKSLKQNKEERQEKPKKKRVILHEEPTEETMTNLAELFKVFGDSTRIRILFTLFDDEINVGGIADRLSMSQSAVSHQLRILRTSQLVDARREGKSMYYYLADDHVRTIIAQGMEHVLE
ncbi:MAG: winged helix-turn-helix transcriptional regulator [Lachnospiraceae bacterium]|nr:winged helix-turn-helix transcriptional regulator [Lachnospiraceae bacterium]